MQEIRLPLKKSATLLTLILNGIEETSLSICQRSGTGQDEGNCQHESFGNKLFCHNYVK